MPVQKWSMGGLAILLGICVFALFFVFVIKPALAHATGIDETKLGIVLAAGFFIVAIVCTRWAKALNKKQSEKL